MIDIIAYRKFYKRQEIDKIRQICGEENLVNTITKASPNLTLEERMSIKKAIIMLKRWIK